MQIILIPNQNQSFLKEIVILKRQSFHPLAAAAAAACSGLSESTDNGIRAYGLGLSRICLLSVSITGQQANRLQVAESRQQVTVIDTLPLP